MARAWRRGFLRPFRLSTPMNVPVHLRPLVPACLAVAVAASTGGCSSPGCGHPEAITVLPAPVRAPYELQRVTMPPYTIEPPDVLTIDAIRVIPKSPYHIDTLDVLDIAVTGTLPESPISGSYTVEPGGAVNLGAPYGAVSVAGLTIDEAQAAIRAELLRQLTEPQVSVTLSQLANKQHIAGEHLVNPDGTVTLGSYGSVFVVGLTLADAKATIERHLSQFLEKPEISIDVFAYNSRSYYVVLQGAGQGDIVTRFPLTGNETVLDAISQINGLEAISSKRIWIARPANQGEQVQILPVDWCAITEQAAAPTNYQILPGDRLFVAEDRLVALDTALAKIIAPAERVLGFTLLGTSTVRSLRNIKSNSNSNSGF